MKRNALGIASLAAGALLVASTLALPAEAAGRGGAGQRSSSGQRICPLGNTPSGVTAQQTARRNGGATAKKAGPNDGTGNQGVGPKNGTGYGAGQRGGNGTGTCDGTGPKGSQNGNKGGKN